MATTTPFGMEMAFVGVLGFIIGGFLPTLIYRLAQFRDLATETSCPKCGHELAFFEEIPGVSRFLLKGKCWHCGEKVKLDYPVKILLRLVAPPAACPQCGDKLAFLEEIPVISWVALRARCRHCRARIPLRYPAIEVTNLALWLLIAWDVGFHVQLAAFLVAASALVVLFVTDIQMKYTPREVTIPTTLIIAVIFALAAARYGEWHRYFVDLAIAAGFLLYGAGLKVFRLPLGSGDVLLMPLIGLILGWLGYLDAVTAVGLGALYALVWVVVTAVRTRTEIAKVVVSLGAWFALGTLSVMVFVLGGLSS